MDIGEKKISVKHSSKHLQNQVLLILYTKNVNKEKGSEKSWHRTTINYLKQDLGLDRFFLKGQIRDQINVTLTSAAYNLRKWVRLRLELNFYILYKTLKNMFYKHFNYYPVCF